MAHRAFQGSLDNAEVSSREVRVGFCTDATHTDLSAPARTNSGAAGWSVPGQSQAERQGAGSVFQGEELSLGVTAMAGKSCTVRAK